MFFLILLPLSGLATAMPATLNTTRAKRWFSVPPGNDHFNPWPEMPVASPDDTPERWVRYCYKDLASATNVATYLDAAIKIWLPAIGVSSLNIRLDPDTGGDPSKYCDQLPGPVDALVVSSEPAGGCGGGAAQASIGYNYASPQQSMRHTLQFCDYRPGAPEATEDFWALAIAHELGHAIGFEHEHQRPDRDIYMNFNCQNHKLYQAGLAAAVADAKHHFPDWSTPEDRGEVICEDPTVATDYFPAILPYLKSKPKDPAWDGDISSFQFDWESIMIYSSTWSSISPNDDTKPVLEGKNGGPTIIYQGGNADPKLAKVSEGDIARVAQLYESGTQANQDAQMLNKWGEWPTR